MADVQLQDAENAGSGTAAPPDSPADAAWLVAAQAKPRLNVQGFPDEQIEQWAEAYVGETGGSDVQGFIEWVAQNQNG